MLRFSESRGELEHDGCDGFGRIVHTHPHTRESEHALSYRRGSPAKKAQTYSTTSTVNDSGWSSWPVSISRTTRVLICRVAETWTFGG